MAEEGQQVQTPKVPYTNPLSAFGNSIILLTNPQNYLYEIELKFRNVKVQDEKVIALGDALMNEYGISSVLGMMETIISQNTIMGRLDDGEIEALRNFLADTLARDLMVNRIKYGIVDMRTRDKIFFVAVGSAFICMKRSWKGGERSFWKGSQTDIHHRISQEGQKKGFLGWGKK